MHYIRNLYDWTLIKSTHPKATWFLALISFIESSFFPIPPDIILIPMIIAKRTKAYVYAFICTISSTLGGIIGYLVGLFFFNSLGLRILDYYHLSEKFGLYEDYYLKFGVLIVLVAGFTPFPFKLITISSGFFGLNFFLFLGVSIVARAMRFFLIAFLLKLFGNTITKIIDKYFNYLTILFIILFVGGIMLLKLL